MAVHTQHPVSAPPTAPIREKTGHLLLRGWCIFVIAAALAGTSWLMAFGTIGAGIAAPHAATPTPDSRPAARPPALSPPADRT